MSSPCEAAREYKYNRNIVPVNYAKWAFAGGNTRDGWKLGVFLAISGLIGIEHRLYAELGNSYCEKVWLGECGRMKGEI